jgi:ethanolaminephosphotransferase
MIQSAFFIMGNSNSLSSVDLGNAYIGVDGYDVGVTGLLTFVSNWSGSVWWTFAGISLIAHGYWLSQSDLQPVSSTEPKDSLAEDLPEDKPLVDVNDNLNINDQDNASAIAAGELISYYASFYIYFAIFFNLALTTLSVSVTILRQHLFIWTVFSPKFLFQGAWIVLHHFMIQTLLATILIGTWLPWCIT